jgi:acyl-coenzyme A thioesterase PaaI-like protein
LHGGTLGALMESTAIFKLLWHGETTAVPKTINITVEYLRGARPEDVFARAVFTRHGRRVANVRVFAYQDDPERPAAVATAHFLLVQE